MRTIALFFAALFGMAIAFGITGVFFFWLANWGQTRLDKQESVWHDDLAEDDVQFEDEDEDLDPSQV